MALARSQVNADPGTIKATSKAVSYVARVSYSAKLMAANFLSGIHPLFPLASDAPRRVPANRQNTVH